MSEKTLIDELTQDQKLRVMGLDYVTQSGEFNQEEWFTEATAVAEFIKSGNWEGMEDKPKPPLKLMKDE